MRNKWMWNNPPECEECGRDLVTQVEIDRGWCDDCDEKDAYWYYLKYGVSPGDNDE